MSEQQQVTIKVKCKGVIRLLKISTDVSYEAFYELLKNSFGISHCQFQYSDEEGDSVELGSQDELREALKVGEKFGPLKITLITHENPSMSAMMNKPPMNLEDNTVSATCGPTALVEPMSSLTINEKPTPKPRPNRKRIGFYTSLCSDIADLEPEKSLSATAQDSQGGGTAKNDPKHQKEPKKHKKENQHRGSKYYASLASDIADLAPEKSSTTTAQDSQGGATVKNDPKNPKEPKKPKKEKRLRGSKYYASLANDIAAMKLAQPDQSRPQAERKEMQKQNQARKMETVELPKKQNVDAEVKQVEKDMSDVTLSDDEPPPKWFDKVVHRMSQSVSSQVLGALNGAVIASTPTVNRCSGKPMMRVGATYIHDGITCNGCKQTIIGPRYKCGNCPNYDLCEQCEVIEDVHDPSHVFIKLRYPGIGIGRRHSVMIPLLKDIIYKSKDVELAEEQDKRMKEVRKKLKQLAKRKREEQVGKKKADKKMKKLKAGSSYSNENLVCSGLDLVFLGDGSYPDGTEVTPEFEFTKCWKIRNTGNIAWNKDTKLMFIYGVMRCLLSNEVDLPHLDPGQEGIAMVTFVAPRDIGQYNSVWRASHNGKNFGSKMWCKIKVVKEEVESENDDEIFLDANDTSVAPTQESFEASAYEPNPEILNQGSSPTTTTEPDPIFHAYTTQQGQEDENGAVGMNGSENQATTSDVSLLECNDWEWDTCLMDDDSPVVNEDDAQDIEVISNASSDDFCVVPLPACFDPDVPLNIEDFGQGSAMEPPASLAQEMNPEVLLEPLVEHKNPLGCDELNSDEAQPATERQQDETIDPEDEPMDPGDEPGSSEEDIRPIPIIPERPTSPPDVVDSRERESPEQTQSAPINIEVVKMTENSNRHPLTMPSFDVRSTISEPVAPQPPSLERTPLIPGRLPASPPGRAVPVVQTQNTELPFRRVAFVPGSFEVHVASGTIEEGQWQAVRTQPPDVVVARQISEEETVTIQPRGAAGTTPHNSSQSTAQFASTLVTGTLKRAIDTVTDTVTNFMTGKDNNASVVYNSNESGDSVHVVQVTIPVEANEGPNQPDTRVLQKQLQEMGFCDRQLNERLLRKHNMDVGKVVTELLHENDNDWSTARH